MRNAGIDKSCGEYIFFIDSDTLEVLLNAALQKGHGCHRLLHLF